MWYADARLYVFSFVFLLYLIFRHPQVLSRNLEQDIDPLNAKWLNGVIERQGLEPCKIRRQRPVYPDRFRLLWRRFCMHDRRGQLYRYDADIHTEEDAKVTKRS